MKLTKVFSFVVGSFGITQASDLSNPKVRAFITDLLGLSSKAGFKIRSCQIFLLDTPKLYEISLCCQTFKDRKSDGRCPAKWSHSAWMLRLLRGHGSKFWWPIRWQLFQARRANRSFGNKYIRRYWRMLDYVWLSARIWSQDNRQGLKIKQSKGQMWWTKNERDFENSKL